MGMHIKLSDASKMAQILDPKWRPQEGDVRQLTPDFFRALDEAFYSDGYNQRRWLQLINRLEHTYFNADSWRDPLRDIQRFVGERPWMALIIPSVIDPKLDEVLCDRAFLRKLVSIRPDDTGLIFQLSEAPTEPELISNLFPAFNTALSCANQWPGILLWRSGRRHESAFLPLSRTDSFIRETAWIFETLANNSNIELRQVAREFRDTFQKSKAKDDLAIIHLSDLHIGKKKLTARLLHLPELVSKIVKRTVSAKKCIIVISGDLVDEPDSEYYEIAAEFVKVLAKSTRLEVLTTMGNHDVRKGGFRSNDYREAAISTLFNTPKIRKFCQGRLAVVLFNSMVDGKEAQGMIGSRQFRTITDELDAGKFSNATLIGILHHHPQPVSFPSWYKQNLFERIFPWKEETSMALLDAPEFAHFIERKNFGCILHGHKHIPFIGRSPGNVAIYGCGSSTGNVKTHDDKPYISVNVISFDPNSRRISARLLVERLDGGGPRDERAEVITVGTMRP